MKITLYIRRANARGDVTMRTDFTREPSDTPRIGNLGLEIKQAIDGIIVKCEERGEVAR